jgi:hypothetical protein
MRASCCRLSLLRRPADSEQRLGFDSLRQPLFELAHELLALVHDLVLDHEDLLPLTALLAFEVLDPVLDLLSDCVTGPPSDLLAQLQSQTAAVYLKRSVNPLCEQRQPTLRRCQPQWRVK